ncbi:MAG: amidohydrolase family protein [Planctomycetes bacterium]|nr:amidohydrolase family protein [Planctomycetota bacterium]
MATSRTFSLRARYLFPIDRPPIRDAWLTVSKGRIAAVGDAPVGERRDLGNVAILPGLINAHTHLEFSELEEPLGRPGMPFTDWIREVVRWRREMIRQYDGIDWRSQAIRHGVEESVRGGATMLGEIATLPWEESGSRYQGLHGVSFMELLGLARERHAELLSAANNYVEFSQSSGCSSKPGLSPHAPYTVSPELIESIATLSARTHVPVAIHLAETREELELLTSASGPFRELLDDLNAWQADVIPLGSTPLDYMKLLAKADRSLIIHGNYLSDEEMVFAGQQRDRMSIIYCPRTHAYFAHDRYPLREMLDRGINVALGTDARASNPNLNVLSEIRFAAKQHQDVSPESILRLATINAAVALGIQESHGTLTPGMQADFIVVPVAPDTTTDPNELLLGSTDMVQQVFRRGEQLFPVKAEA